MYEKRSEQKEMSDTAYAADRIRFVVPREHRSISEWIAATARRLGWPYSRAKAIWYNEARRIDAFEMREIEDAITKKEITAARAEYAELMDRVARLESALLAADSDFHGPQIDALGSVDRTGSGRK